MLIFGTGREEIDLGPVHPQDCEVCGKEQPFRLRLSYRYEHVFWVLGNVRARSWLLVCDVCGTPFRIPGAAAFKLGHLKNHPVPFLRRFGCLLTVALVILVAIISWAVERAQHR